MDNKRLLVGYLNNVIIVNESGKLCDRKYLVAFLYELAYEYGILISPEYRERITQETIDKYFTDFFVNSVCQPFYPNLIPVEVKDIRKINTTLAKHISKLGKEVREFKVITESKLTEYYKRGIFKPCIDAEFEWLSLKTEDKSLHLIYTIYKHYSQIKDSKLRFKTIPRKVRVTFLQELEKCDNIKVQNLHEKQLWKKLSKVIHVSKKKFPKSYEFFKGLDHKVKYEPPKQKLKNLLEKAWRDNKEFEALEEYLKDQDQSLTIRHLISDYNDLEIRHRISGYKKIGSHEFGDKKVGSEETEIVDLILIQLKQKILDMIKPVGKSYSFPEMFKRLPASYVIHEEGYAEKKIVEKEFDILLKGYGSNYGFTEVGDSGSYVRTMTTRTSIGLKIKFLDGIKSDKKADYLVIYRKEVRDRVSGTELGDWSVDLKPVGQDSSRNLLLWVLDFKENRLMWIGESLNQFYHGDPDNIKLEQWKNIVETFIYRRNFTMFELCEALYGKSDPTKEVVTIKTIREDLATRNSR